MLLGLLIVVSVYCCVSVVLYRQRVPQVLLCDELLPDLNYLLVEVPRIVSISLLLEDLTHVVIAAAQVYALWSMKLAFKVDCLAQLV